MIGVTRVNSNGLTLEYDTTELLHMSQKFLYRDRTRVTDIIASTIIFVFFQKWLNINRILQKLSRFLIDYRLFGFTIVTNVHSWIK